MRKLSITDIPTQKLENIGQYTAFNNDKKIMPHRNIQITGHETKRI